MNKALATFKNYAWRKGSHSPRGWAVIFGERVDLLQEQLGHAPSSAEVLEDARDENSPLHQMFNWENEDAAEKFRKIQASVLLSSLVVRVEIMQGSKSQEIEMPVRVSVRGGEKGASKGREHIRDVLSNRELRDRMLEGAANELISLQRRYSYLTELSRVFHEVDLVVRKKMPKLLGHGNGKR